MKDSSLESCSMLAAKIDRTAYSHPKPSGRYRAIVFSPRCDRYGTGHGVAGLGSRPWSPRAPASTARTRNLPGSASGLICYVAG